MEKQIARDRRILPINKTHLEKFSDLCRAQGLAPATLLKDLYSLRFVARHVGKEFTTCRILTAKSICTGAAIISRAVASTTTPEAHIGTLDGYEAAMADYYAQ